jgi:hypothetical protein
MPEAIGVRMFALIDFDIVTESSMNRRRKVP